MQGRVACWLYQALAGAEGVFWSSEDNSFSSTKAAFFKKFRGCKPGLPDMIFLKGGRACFIELKASMRTRPSEAQKRVFAELEAAGCRYAVCRSGEEVEKTLRRWRFPLACPFHDGYPIPDEWKSQPWKRIRPEPMTPAERARLARERQSLPRLTLNEWQAAIAARESERAQRKHLLAVERGKASWRARRQGPQKAEEATA
ncbi:MAG: VRR-NUC domain-containing protein [Rhodospirillales bacterium]|nr:VRR-NUC domain-containing protein [Rhodospirillales bacterium]